MFLFFIIHNNYFYKYCATNQFFVSQKFARPTVRRTKLKKFGRVPKMGRGFLKLKKKTLDFALPIFFVAQKFVRVPKMGHGNFFI